MFSESKRRNFLYALIGAALLFLFFGYYLNREDFTQLFSAYTILFILYLYLLNQSKNLDLKFIIGAGIFFRLLFLFSIPVLSDDIYRFIWDGRLWQAGINPFQFTPSEIINSNFHISGIDQELYEKLNSPNYFTVYPPFHQLIFYLSTLADPENLWLSILIHRTGILLAELISFYAIVKILELLHQPIQKLALYALNPLVIIELSGNLHYEAWMIAFLLLAILLMIQNKVLLSSLLFSMSVLTKLWPLMFLPLLFGSLKNVKTLLFYASVGVIVMLSFLIVFDPAQLQNMAHSLDLYFRKFEFNASVFYAIRGLGFFFLDYDIVQTAGPVLALVTFIFIS